MQTITITIDNGVRVVDATTTELTRTVGMVWSISIVDTAGAAITHASVERWELIVAQDFHAATAVLASGTIYNPETGALVIAINGNTTQMATLLDGKRALAGKAMLVGYDADQIRVVAYVWDCTLRNVTSDDSTPPSDAAEDLWATRAWVDALVDSVTTPGLLPAVTTLPATPIAGQMIHLTTADDAAKAAPGVYVHDGVGWTCISYEAAYALGNLGATPTLALIPGASYTATVNAEITSFTVAFTRPGLASITLTNETEYAIAQPTMTGRTSKLLADGAWDGAATTLSKALLEDDGTYIIASAGGLV